MDISVVIVSFNTKEILNLCLKSLKVATKNLKAEIFVVDNNSVDDTISMVRKNFPDVLLTENSQNRGFSKANNQSLKKASAKYILVLNPDTQVMPDTLNKMIKFMDQNPNVGIATCRVELQNGKLDLDCRRRFPTLFRAFTHFSGLSKIFPGSKIFDSYYMGYLPEDRKHEIDSCVGAFMMVRKSAMEKVGLFDEDFFFYGEDLDWCWRFKEAGFKIMYTPITKIIHFKGAASGIKPQSFHLTKATLESKKRALYESVRSMELFYRKHHLKEHPFFINWIVLMSLKLLQIYRIKSFSL